MPSRESLHGVARQRPSDERHGAQAIEGLGGPGDGICFDAFAGQHVTGVGARRRDHGDVRLRVGVASLDMRPLHGLFGLDLGERQLFSRPDAHDELHVRGQKLGDGLIQAIPGHEGLLVGAERRNRNHGLIIAGLERAVALWGPVAHRSAVAR